MLALIFIVTPSALILSVGILVLAFGQKAHETVFGILILSFAAVLVAGVIATLVYVRRERGIARLQTDFVSKVSHDLRTPLTSIRMFVETLQMGRVESPETTAQCLNVIATETARLTTLIDRLLLWARMEAGQLRYATAPHTVEDLVESALDAFAPQLLVTPARVTCELPPDLPRVNVNLQAMTEALLNLLQNAHRYTGADKQITLRAQSRGPVVELEVEDNGPGVPEVAERRIFEKFYRAPDAELGNVPGTGLGLAIVENIVQAHGGTVALCRRPERGAIFVITLPAVS
ncbi:MAG: sensor histidine kinase [Deltaproteobacteria bacterium]|nr:sensor histidine kinase [Deltaproteobacteria bacterium]